MVVYNSIRLICVFPADRSMPVEALHFAAMAEASLKMGGDLLIGKHTKLGKKSTHNCIRHWNNTYFCDL